MAGRPGAGADTLVCLGNRFYGKPADLADASRMLAELQGRTHQVVTGVCLIHLRTHRQRLFAEVTDVTFRALDTGGIDRYLNQVHLSTRQGLRDPGTWRADCARDLGSFSNVVGLPVERLLVELAAARAGRSD